MSGYHVHDRIEMVLSSTKSTCIRNITGEHCIRNTRTTLVNTMCTELHSTCIRNTLYW